MKPLNGTKTHPLSEHAKQALRDLEPIKGTPRPLPRQAFNPGIANRLLRENLVESVQLPSPYATHKGRNIEFFRLTDTGRLIAHESA